MRIAFITGSLEPGRDGVGDYTKGFADELCLQGHDVLAIALRDRFVSKPLSTEQQVAGRPIQTLRLPSELAWAESIAQAGKALDQFDPEWVSLQFVSYTFQPKGMVYGLAGKLAPLLRGRKLHIMFHELWRGAQRGAPFKERLIGMVQKYFVVSFVKQVKPTKVHTSNLAYQSLLQKCGIETNVMPLFGNISITQKTNEWIDAELRKVGVTNLNRNQFMIFGMFGGIPSEWSAEGFLKAVGEVLGKKERRLMLLTIGVHSAESENLLKVAAQLFSERVRIVNFGAQSEERISEFLQCLDFGVATAPWCLLGKSGSAAAMLEHGLPVMVFRDDVDLGVTDPGSPRLIKMQGDWAKQTLQTSKLSPKSVRPTVVGNWLRGL